MRATDGFVLHAGGVGASGTFVLSGGKYQFSIPTATFGGGNVVVQQLGSDALTWVPVTTALSAVGVNVFEIPPGTFRLFSVTATVIEASVTRIPGE